MNERESWFVLKVNDVDVRVWGSSEEACRFVQLDDDEKKRHVGFNDDVYSALVFYRFQMHEIESV